VRPNALKRGLQTIHLWVGLILAVPIVAIGLTGSILIVQRESAPLMRPAATAAGERQPLTKIAEAARPAAPEGTRLGRIELPARAGAPAVVQFDYNTFPQRTAAVYVDPVSLAVLAPADPVGKSPAMQSVQRLHEFLWLPSGIGLRIVGYVGIAMTFMGLSGLYLWWPRGAGWRHAFWLRRGSRGLRLHLDLHHVAGFWGSAVFLLMSISGLYLTFPETISSAVWAILPADMTGVEPAATYKPGTPPLDADSAIVVAESAVTNAHAVAVQMPDRAGRPIVVYLDTEGMDTKVPPLLVTLNPDTGHVNFIDDPRRYGIGEKVLNWQYALHFGVGVSWLWKSLVFLSGLLPLMLAVTGASIWWLKRRPSRARATAEAAAVTQPAE
jgi:uncharacterized iron-regulated membrane protein